MLEVLKKIREFNVFKLGVSALLYYFLIFFITPLLILGGVGLWVGDGFGINYTALAYLVLGAISLAIGYLNPLGKKLASKLPNILRGEWNFKRAFWVFWFFLSFGLVIKILKILVGGYFHLNKNPAFTQNVFYSLVGFAEWFSYFAIAIAFIAYFSLLKRDDSRYKIWIFLAWGSLVLEVFYALPSCNRLAVIVPIVIYLIVRSYVWKVDALQVVLVIFIALLLLFPFGNACRNPEILNGYSVIQDKGVRAKAVGALSVDSFLARTNQAFIFSRIIERQGEFLYGKTMLNFFVSLGPPRFIWRDKPIVTLDGNKFGHEMGVLPTGDSKTSVGMTLPGELYINFGLFGIIFGMFVFGIVWRFMYEYLIPGSGISPGGIFIYAPIWIQIIKGMEDQIGALYGGMVKLIVLLIFVAVFLKTDKNNV